MASQSSGTSISLVTALSAPLFPPCEQLFGQGKEDLIVTTFVVVADGSRARFMKSNGCFADLSEFEDLTNPSARVKPHDQLSDKPGRGYRGYNSSGQSRHAMDFRSNVRRREQLQFAKTIGERLERARVNGECEQMVLVAAPTFLGMLRKELSPQTARLVTAEVDKDLVMENLRSIRGRLPYRI